MIKKFLKERQVGGTQKNADQQSTRPLTTSVSPHAQSSSNLIGAQPHQSTLIDNFTRNSPVLAQSNSQALTSNMSQQNGNRAGMIG